MEAKNSKIKNIAIIVVFTLAVLFLVGKSAVTIIKSLSPQVFSDDTDYAFDFASAPYVKGNVFMITEKYCTLKHSLNFIPTGKDYYYIVCNEDETSAIAIRAPKGYDEKFIDALADGDGTVEIAGLVTRFNYKMASVNQETAQLLRNNDVSFASVNYYIDLLSVRYAILTIIAVLAVAVLVAIGTYYAKVKCADPKSVMEEFPGGKAGFLIYTLLLVAALFLLIHCLSMT